MLGGPSIPTRGMLMSTFFLLTVEPMLTEVSIPTAHGSSHGLVPQVQYSEHFSSPDIHTHHHSAPSTIFTPGESLSTDPDLICGPGPSTVTQDEPIDEVMMPDKGDGPDSYCCSCILISFETVLRIIENDLALLQSHRTNPLMR